MTGYESKKAAAQDKLKCQCSLSTSLTGDGCQYCNPEYMDDDALTIAYQSGYYDGKKAAQTTQEPDWKDQYEKQKRRAEMWIAKYEKDIGLLERAKPMQEQPAQEPSSVTYKEVQDSMNALEKGSLYQQVIAEELGERKLYTAPPQRPWVGLTEQEFQLIYDMGRTPSGMMEMVETKLKGKNDAA
jgi:hypothetical protein